MDVKQRLTIQTELLMLNLVEIIFTDYMLKVNGFSIPPSVKVFAFSGHTIKTGLPTFQAVKYTFHDAEILHAMLS